MNEHPILFSGEMVRAILEDRKTQTRRVIKPQPFSKPDGTWHIELKPQSGYNSERTLRNILPYRCPYGQPGDRLWVKETWVPYDPDDGEQYYKGPIPKEKPEGIAIAYRADSLDDPGDGWRPSMFMPRWASRITLEIVNVRVEQVQDITQADILAEGIRQTPDGFWLAPLAGTPDFPWNRAEVAYASLWNDINARRGFDWDMNSWVWVIEFKKVNNVN